VIVSPMWFSLFRSNDGRNRLSVYRPIR
jgi:hypothetical protein